MNVRHYLEKALRATQLLAADHRLGAEACRELGGVLEVRDTPTRHCSQQTLEAPLAVVGGSLEVGDAGRDRARPREAS